jgi:hypothetical protein
LYDQYALELKKQFLYDEMPNVDSIFVHLQLNKKKIWDKKKQSLGSKLYDHLSF